MGSYFGLLHQVKDLRSVRSPPVVSKGSSGHPILLRNINQECLNIRSDISDLRRGNGLGLLVKRSSNLERRSNDIAAYVGPEDAVRKYLVDILVTRERL